MNIFVKRDSDDFRFDPFICIVTKHSTSVVAKKILSENNERSTNAQF